MRGYCLAGRATGELDDFDFTEVWRSARRRSRLKTFFGMGSFTDPSPLFATLKR